MRRSSEEKQQFPYMVRHFFNRFFDNELVSREAEMRVTITHILALLAVPGIVTSFFLLPRYVYLAFEPPYVQDLASSVDKYFFVSFAMIVMGFITALEWEALFPDLRDYRTMIPLPVRARTLFGAKLAALILFLVVFSLDINVFSSVLFPLVAAPAGASISNTIRVIAAHAASVLAGSAFIFFFFVALQGVLMNLLGYWAFRRISPYVQYFSLFCLLSLLLLFPKISAAFPAWKSANSVLLYVLPPMWFLALYETLAGNDHAVFRSLAGIAMQSLAAVVALSLVTYVISYQRHMKKALEAAGRVASAPSGFQTAATRVVDRFVARDPLERASFYFIGKTIARSGKHRLLLAAYVGAGLAFIVDGLLESPLEMRRGGLLRPGSVLLSIPLILSFFVLSGMRFIFTIPAELRANWIFRIAERAGQRRLVSGARKAMLVFGLAPLFALLAPLYIVFFGWGAAILHILFSIVLSVALVELLLLEWHKIPFTCSYLPGKANVTLLWVAYWFAFTTYAYTMVTLEEWMMRAPYRLAVFYALAGAALVALIRHRNRVLDSDFAFVYEEQADPVVRTLDLTHWS